MKKNEVRDTPLVTANDLSIIEDTLLSMDTSTIASMTDFYSGINTYASAIISNQGFVADLSKAIITTESLPDNLKGYSVSEILSSPKQTNLVLNTGQNPTILTTTPTNLSNQDLNLVSPSIPVSLSGIIGTGLAVSDSMPLITTPTTQRSQNSTFRFTVPATQNIDTNYIFNKIPKLKEDIEIVRLEAKKQINKLKSDNEKLKADVKVHREDIDKLKEEVRVLKMARGSNTEDISVGLFSYGNGVVKYKGAVLNFTPQMTKMLVILLERTDRYTPYSELGKEISPDGCDLSLSNVQKVASHLRRELHSILKEDVLKNKTGIGYMIQSKNIR